MLSHLCSQKSLFHRHFRLFMRNQVDLEFIFAQDVAFRISYKTAWKRAEKGQKAHNCSALPCKVICVAAQCRHAYSCNKIRRGLSILNFFDLARFCVVKGDWRTCSLLSSNRHTARSLGLHGQKRRIYTSRLRFALSLFMRINYWVLLWQLSISFSFLLVILLIS